MGPCGYEGASLSTVPPCPQKNKLRFRSNWTDWKTKQKERQRFRPNWTDQKTKFYQELLKEKGNPRLKGNRKGIMVKGKEFYIPILNTFPTKRKVMAQKQAAV